MPGYIGTITPTSISGNGCSGEPVNRIDDIVAQSRQSIQFVQSALRSSAFEVYRKPSAHNQLTNNRTFYSPDQGAGDSMVAGVTDHSIVANKQEKSLGDVMHQLKEQNGLLLRLCYDLSEELKTIKQKKEEVLYQLDAGGGGSGGSSSGTATAINNITTSSTVHHSAV